MHKHLDGQYRPFCSNTNIPDIPDPDEVVHRDRQEKGQHRPPSENASILLKELESFLRTVQSVPLVLTGDFNLDALSPTRPAVNEYLNIMSSWGIQPTIHTFTREEHLVDKLVASCIDHVNVRLSCARVVSAVIKKKFQTTIL